MSQPHKSRNRDIWRLSRWRGNNNWSCRTREGMGLKAVLPLQGPGTIAPDQQASVVWRRGLPAMTPPAPVCSGKKVRHSFEPTELECWFLLNWLWDFQQFSWPLWASSGIWGWYPHPPRMVKSTQWGVTRHIEGVIPFASPAHIQRRRPSKAHPCYGVGVAQISPAGQQRQRVVIRPGNQEESGRWNTTGLVLLRGENQGYPRAITVPTGAHKDRGGGPKKPRALRINMLSGLPGWDSMLPLLESAPWNSGKVIEAESRLFTVIKEMGTEKDVVPRSPTGPCSLWLLVKNRCMAPICPLTSPPLGTHLNARPSEHFHSTPCC